jgi:hypothetical protein
MVVCMCFYVYVEMCTRRLACKAGAMFYCLEGTLVHWEGTLVLCDG